MALHRELNAQMKIRITEPVFFLGSNRQVGDVIDAPVGPYRTQVIAGGLTRIAQFVEMAEEIKQTIQDAAGSAAKVAEPAAIPVVAQGNAPAPFGEALAVVLKPTAPPAPSAAKAGSLAARVRALTTRRAKFHDLAAAILAQGEDRMTKIEASGPDVLQRSVNQAQDELTAILDLDDAMKAAALLNGPLSGS